MWALSSLTSKEQFQIAPHFMLEGSTCQENYREVLFQPGLAEQNGMDQDTTEF